MRLLVFKLLVLVEVLAIAEVLLAADSPATSSTKTAHVFPEVGDLVEHKELPDPLVGSDGQKITTPEQWKARREEMKRVVEHYFTGTIPPAPGNVKGKVLEERTVLDGKAKFQHVHLTFGPEEKLGFDVGVL